MRSSSTLPNLRYLVAALAMSAVFPSVAAAQFDTATVLGTVRDRLQRARARRHADPDKRGDRHHGVHGVGPGRQLPVSERPDRHLHHQSRVAGFSTAVAENILVTVNARLRVDLDAAGRQPRRARGGHRLDAGARDRVERSRAGDRTRANREPAVERSQLRRSRPAGAGRSAVGHLRFPRRLVQRARPAERAQQLHPGRRRQQQLRHQQPGLLQPGRAGIARCRAGVQGPDRQLQRRVRPQRAVR